MKDWAKFRFRVPTWLVGTLVLGLLAGGGYTAYSRMSTGQRQEASRRVQTATVERISLPITIAANGTVQPERSINVSPKNSGVLKELLVKEGDRVEAGQVLAYMDSSNLQGQLTQSKAQVASAQANLDQLLAGNRPQEIAQAQAQVASAQANLNRLVAGNRPQEVAQAQAQLTSTEANLRQAQLTLNQNQQLYTAGALSLRELDTSRATYDSAKAEVEQARLGLNLQRSGTRPEEIAQARAQVEQAKQALNLQQSGARPEEIAQARAQLMSAEGALQTTQTQINDATIRAPFSGIVTRKFSDPGSFVTPTTASSDVSSATSSSILALASNNQVVAKVAETSVPKIKVGQGVTIEADAYPNQSFTGKVIQVATQSTVEQNVTNFEVKMSVDDSKNLLQSGMNVSVEFQVGALDNALVIPTAALVRQEQGSGVFLAGQGENSRPRFQRITTSAIVEDKTVVTSGLKAGDKVMLSFPEGERPPSRTPSFMPGAGRQRPGGSGASSGGSGSGGSSNGGSGSGSGSGGRRGGG
ncbi:MAG: efflux RND transporter periplasmic adaptor subunit [Trichocoleus desertorum ATA4-8-CV12]|nr:efflux RND transporter periplasmic adaptor subunit [Trichocoleus desertorum ATA4-8-CV12]